MNFVVFVINADEDEICTSKRWLLKSLRNYTENTKENIFFSFYQLTFNILIYVVHLFYWFTNSPDQEKCLYD